MGYVVAGTEAALNKDVGRRGAKRDARWISCGGNCESLVGSEAEALDRGFCCGLVDLAQWLLSKILSAVELS